jgi:hypothetical protein
MSGLHRMHVHIVVMVGMIGMVATALLAAAALPAASQAEEPLAFSGPRAFAHLETISGLGPRASGRVPSLTAIPSIPRACSSEPTTAPAAWRC